MRALRSATIVASVAAVVATVIATIPAATDPVGHHRCRSDDGGRARHWAANHAAPSNSSRSEGHVNLLRLEASSASIDARIAWIGIRPLATN